MTVHCFWLKDPIVRPFSLNQLWAGPQRQVWLIDIRKPPFSIEKDTVLLSDAEQTYYNKLHVMADKIRFLTGRIAVRKLLSTLLHIPPQQLSLEKTYYGKPVIASYHNSTLHFNITHAGNLVSIVIDNRPVGIDTEPFNGSLSGLSAIVTRHFHEKEAYYIQKSANRQKAFTTLWTRKESFLKACGTGITNELSQVPCLDGIHNIPDSNLFRGRYETTSFIYQGDYVVSVCSAERQDEIITWSWQ